MLYFYNAGEIDINGATVAGLSVKSGDAPIGYFGTGLKYSIACILRWGGSVTIYSGTDRFDFDTQSLEFRGESFDQIVKIENGVTKELGFTTEYGKNWLPWQVFRELYANALDERGDVTRNKMSPVAGETLIVIECPKLELEYANRDDIIINRHITPLISTPYGEIYPGESSCVYYRGVRVAMDDCIYRYNVTTTQKLTEDRTLTNKYSYQNELACVVMLCTNEEMIRNILTVEKGIETNLSFPSWAKYTDQFLQACKDVFAHQPQNQKVRSFLKEIDPALVRPRPIKLNGVRQRVLENSIKFIKRMEEFPDNFPEISVVDLGQRTLGQYDSKSVKIYLDPKTFEQGSKQVVSTLYEELTHWHTGHSDCDYPMQTHLFNKIISLYEENFGEPA